jgi:glycosyltransferase involved in cell wall biosynthesis
MRVSTPHRDYADLRTILVDHDDEIELLRERDAFAAADTAMFRLARRTFWVHRVHSTPPLSRADLFHLFGAVSYSRRPWVTTAESSSPYDMTGPVDGWARLAIGNCKAILALSNWARDEITRTVVNRADRDEIISKLQVLPPPQALVSRPAPEPDGTIRLVYVGRDFFTKGGLETLLAFDRVVADHPELHLTIVSSLNPGRVHWWPSIPGDEVASARRLIAKHSAAIDWQASLPNAECLRLMANSDVGLLPTLNDTYGYSALEMMAAGCPVIATAQRALAETVAADRGWLIELPLTVDGTIVPRNAADAMEVLACLVDRLAEIFASICADPTQLAPRAERAVDYVREFHDPAAYAARLREVYRAACRTA